MVERSLRLALLGRSIAASQSPSLYAEMFAKSGVTGTYALLDVEPSQAEVHLEAFRRGDWDGWNVTAPYKEWMTRHVDDLDGSAEAIGAVNTVVCREDRLVGCNTDVDGILKAVRGFFVPGPVVVLGSGGAARAAIWALRGRKLYLFARAGARRDAMLRSFPWIELVETEGDLRALRIPNLVQATSVGFHSGDCLFDAPLQGAKAAFDMIYTPRRTRWLAMHKAAGARVQNGETMLRAQAERSFQMFIGGNR